MTDGDNSDDKNIVQFSDYKNKKKPPQPPNYPTYTAISLKDLVEYFLSAHNTPMTTDYGLSARDFESLYTDNDESKTSGLEAQYKELRKQVVKDIADLTLKTNEFLETLDYSKHKPIFASKLNEFFEMIAVLDDIKIRLADSDAKMKKTIPTITFD